MSFAEAPASFLGKRPKTDRLFSRVPFKQSTILESKFSDLVTISDLDPAEARRALAERYLLELKLTDELALIFALHGGVLEKNLYAISLPTRLLRRWVTYLALRIVSFF